MTQDLIKEEVKLRDALDYFLKGNKFAVEFCMSTLKLAHFWDDVADGEKLTPKDVSEALVRMAWMIPANPFYQTWQNQLIPLALNAILCWQDSNVLDKGSEHDMHISYGLRAAGLQTIAVCAFLIGGIDWAREVGPDIRRLLVEDLPTYVGEMKSGLPE